MDQLKKAIGMKVKAALDETRELRRGEEIEMLDANGYIQYRKLNTGLLRKYKNPFRILYLWAVQESLEVQAILEAINTKNSLDDKRRKMMRKIKMTEAELERLKPSRNSNVKDIFDSNVDNEGKSAASSYETQTEIVHIVTITEMLASYLSEDILPRFKQERVQNYKKIMA